jgi:hypothetical protein
MPSLLYQLQHLTKYKETTMTRNTMTFREAIKDMMSHPTKQLISASYPETAISFVPDFGFVADGKTAININNYVDLNDWVTL